MKSSHRYHCHYAADDDDLGGDENGCGGDDDESGEQAFPPLSVAGPGLWQ